MKSWQKALKWHENQSAEVGLSAGTSKVCSQLVLDSFCSRRSFKNKVVAHLMDAYSIHLIENTHEISLYIAQKRRVFTILLELPFEGIQQDLPEQEDVTSPIGLAK